MATLEQSLVQKLEGMKIGTNIKSRNWEEMNTHLTMIKFLFLHLLRKVVRFWPTIWIKNYFSSKFCQTLSKIIFETKCIHLPFVIKWEHSVCVHEPPSDRNLQNKSPVIFIIRIIKTMKTLTKFLLLVSLYQGALF